MKFVKVLLFFVVSSIIFLSSCNKVQNNIVGTWTQHEFGKPTTGITVWQFTQDGYIIKTFESESGVKVDSAFYNVTRKGVSSRIVITDAWAYYINGTFLINDISNDLLILTREADEFDETNGAYYRLEFTRN